MICYLDRTFCAGADKCSSSCDRRVFPVDEERAEKLKLPIAYSDFRQTCKKYVPLEEKK